MKLGMIGLPNVGKSTLFNAITNAGAQAANYPFCTIEPNVGVVAVPDRRLDELAKIYDPEKYTPATVEFVDIAGLVKGAAKGEGLGNKFLANIREVDALIHVVRCFEDDNVIHVDGSVNAARDIEVINLELIFSDIEVLDRRIAKTEKDYKGGNRSLGDELDVLNRLVDQGNTVLVIEHNLDVIKTSDYIIDLGPEGGDRGGTVVCMGTPEEVAACEKSYTGQFIKKLL